MRTIELMKQRIKVSLIMMVTLVLLSLASFAQSETGMAAKTPEARAQKWTDWMKSELTLSDDQESKVHAVNLKYAEKTQALRDSDESRRTKFSKLKEGDEAKDKELKAILSDEQYAKYQDKKGEMQKKTMKAMRDARKDN